MMEKVTEYVENFLPSIIFNPESGRKEYKLNFYQKHPVLLHII